MACLSKANTVLSTDKDFIHTMAPEQPNLADFFWIESKQTSSGSRHQLEVPIAAAPFFNVSEEDRSEKKPITLDIGGSIFDKEMRFFPSNSMWRIYLPTAEEGGFPTYQGKVLVFDDEGGMRYKLSHHDFNDPIVENFESKTNTDRTKPGPGGRTYGFGNKDS